MTTVPCFLVLHKFLGFGLAVSSCKALVLPLVPAQSFEQGRSSLVISATAELLAPRSSSASGARGEEDFENHLWGLQVTGAQQLEEQYRPSLGSL